MTGQASIVDGVRTPRGRGKGTGALHPFHPQELLAQCLNALAARTGVDPALIEDVVVGNGINEGDHGDCIGRLAVLAAGWPVEVPGFTLNRFCGSGQQAVTLAAMGVMSGQQDAVIGGGVESMSRFSLRGVGTVDGDNPALRERYPIVPQGISADLIATLDGFTRQDCDAFALTSQDRAAKAQAEGRFDDEIVPVTTKMAVKDKETGEVSMREVTLAKDEGNRPDTTIEGLAKLQPVMGPGSIITAGNASQLCDGASGVLVVSEAALKAHRPRPARPLHNLTVTAGDPVIMLEEPIPATRRARDRTRA